MIRTEIGEIEISTKAKDYIFLPSFENISKIGTSIEIIDAYSVLSGISASIILNNFKQPQAFIFEYLSKQMDKQLPLAINVLECCCNEDVKLLTGEYKGKQKLKYKSGLMTADNIILIAKSLLEYGVVGKAKVRVSQRNGSRSYVSEFKVTDYINNARIHLNMSLDEAKKLTMTEYIMLMSQKHPDNEGLTKEEYDSAFNDYFKEREKIR